MVWRSVLRRRNSMSADFDLGPSIDATGDSRRRSLTAALHLHFARIIGVDAFERRGEAIGVALPTHFAVGDDIDAGPLHIADGEQGRVVLSLFQKFLGDPPHRGEANPWNNVRLQHGVVDQPIWLRIAADDGRRDELLGHAWFPAVYGAPA